MPRRGRADARPASTPAVAAKRALASGKQPEEGEADRQAAVADAHGVGEAEEQRQEQRRRGERDRLAEDAGELAPRRGPPERRPRARHHPLSDVDPGQRNAEPDREGEVVPEEVVEGDEVERQRHQSQKAAPDERAEAPARAAGQQVGQGTSRPELTVFPAGPNMGDTLATT